MPGTVRTRWALIASAVSCVAVLAAALASPAGAFHIPGAQYSGYVSGGGSISFTVSGDGAAVTNLTMTGPITAGNCTQGSKQYAQPIPISNNSFDNGEVSGGFPNVRGAYGRYSFVVPGVLSSCRITGTWSAITGASPRGSRECRSAQAHLKKIKRRLRKANASGNRGKIRKLGGKWRKARAKRDQFCG
jgi:hypothetical protein